MKKITIFLVGLVVLLSASPVYARHGSDDGASGASGASGATGASGASGATGATGVSPTRLRLKIKNEIKKNKHRLVLNLHVPFHNTILPVSSFRNARALDVRATLSRDGAPYAICFLAPNRDRNRPFSIEYKVDLELKIKKNRFRSKKGYCDIDLNQADVQRGLPELNRGDSIVVTEESKGVVLEKVY